MIDRKGKVQNDGLTQRAAAHLLGISVSFLRASSCPRLEIPGNGPGGKPLVRYFREDVLTWAGRRAKQVAPRGDRAAPETRLTGADDGPDKSAGKSENTVENTVNPGSVTG